MLLARFHIHGFFANTTSPEPMPKPLHDFQNFCLQNPKKSRVKNLSLRILAVLNAATEENGEKDAPNKRLVTSGAARLRHWLRETLTSWSGWMNPQAERSEVYFLSTFLTARLPERHPVLPGNEWERLLGSCPWSPAALSLGRWQQAPV